MYARAHLHTNEAVRVFLLLPLGAAPCLCQLIENQLQLQSILN